MEYLFLKKFIGIFIIFIGYAIFVISMEKNYKYRNFLFMLSFIINMIGVISIFYFTLQ